MTQELNCTTASERILVEKKESNLKEMVYPTAEQSQQGKDALASLISGWRATAGEDRKKAVDIMRKYNP